MEVNKTSERIELEKLADEKIGKFHVAFRKHYGSQFQEYKETIISFARQEYMSIGGARVVIEKFIRGIFNDLGIDLKTATAENNIKFDGSNEIQASINLLHALGYCTANEQTFLHQIRLAGNDKDHGIGKEQLTLVEVSDKLNSCIAAFQRIYLESVAPKISKDVNAPKPKPNVYSRGTITTFGDWSKCYTRSDLREAKNYSDLETLANASNLDAMIEIAIGFISPTSTWNTIGDSLDKINTIINYPTKKRSGCQDEYNKHNCYDLRYYYWACNVTEVAFSMYESGRWADVKKTYLTPILIDTLKYHFISTIIPSEKFVSSIEWDRGYYPVYQDSSKVLESLYGVSKKQIRPNAFHAATLLLRLLEQYQEYDIVPIKHFDINAETVIYILYCLQACKYYLPRLRDSSAEDVRIQETFVLAPEDKGIPPTIELLRSRAGESGFLNDYCKFTCDFIESHIKVTKETDSYRRPISVGVSSIKVSGINQHNTNDKAHLSHDAAAKRLAEEQAEEIHRQAEEAVRRQAAEEAQRLKAEREAEARRQAAEEARRQNAEHKAKLDKFNAFLAQKKPELSLFRIDFIFAIAAIVLYTLFSSRSILAVLGLLICAGFALLRDFNVIKIEATNEYNFETVNRFWNVFSRQLNIYAIVGSVICLFCVLFL